MITDIVVWASVVFTVVFVAAWAVSSGLRAWIERPKYTFLQAVQEYDRAAPLRASVKEQNNP